VAQVATLTTNQMTATAIVFSATATAAAVQGTILPPPGQPVQPGQPTPDTSGVVQPTPQGGIVITFTPTSVGGQCNTHLISPGETLSRIALTYNVTVNQIAQANNIVNPDLILAGDTLIIPCPVPATPTPVPTLGSGQGGVQVTPVPGTTTGPFTYIVEPGDNLYRLSIRFNVSMAALMQANGLTPATINTIYAGQQLYIPAATVVATPAPVVVTVQPTPQAGQALPAG
jgi:LysM repeat protein